MRKFIITVNGQSYDVEVEEVKNIGKHQVSGAQVSQTVSAQMKKASAPAATLAPATNGTAVKINAPMPGSILKINVSRGEAIKRGQSLLVLEAMKMENEITAPTDGKIADIKVNQGECVTAGQILVEII